MAALFVSPFLLLHSWLPIIVWLSFVTTGLPLAVIDLQHHRLPDVLTRTLLLVVVLVMIVYSWQAHNFSRLWPATLGLLF